MSIRTLAFLARTLLLIWAGWWTFFVLAAAWEGNAIPFWQGFVAASIGILLFTGSAAFTLYAPRYGTVLLAVEGITFTLMHLLFFHNPPLTRLFLLATMALPPVLVALLLYLSHPPRYSGA
jgi:hypothetical protein